MFANADFPEPPKTTGLGIAPRFARDPKPRDEGEEEACPAFGFLRGARDRAQVIEFRLGSGDTVAFPYSWLGPIRYNPSAGLLLRFSGDIVTLVVIRGSNLDVPVGSGASNLTDRGLYRHRVTFVREMDPAEIRKVGAAGPTVDRIDIVDFEAPHEIPAWMLQHAPHFIPAAR